MKREKFCGALFFVAGLSAWGCAVRICFCFSLFHQRVFESQFLPGMAEEAGGYPATSSPGYLPGLAEVYLGGKRRITWELSDSLLVLEFTFY